MVRLDPLRALVLALLAALAAGPLGCGAQPDDDGSSPAAAAAAPAADDPAVRRWIRVAVACDEEYREAARRAGLDWRRDAFERVRQASAPYERDFGIRWEPVRYVPWTSDDEAPSLQDLRQQLRKLPPGPADVVLGLVGQSSAGEGQPVYAALGNAEYFGNTAIVGVGWDGSVRDRGREPNAIAHELGHLLGAWHTVEPDTIMTAPSHDISRFDAQSRRLLVLTRDLDFRRGVASLGPETRAAIDALWREGHEPGAEQPVADAHTMRGWRRLESGDRDGAAADFLESIAIWEACAGPDAAGLVSPLCGRARLFGEQTVPDSAAELAWALRANRISVAHDVREDPVGMSWMVLGHARWANGQAEESIAAYAEAFRRTLAGYGPSHPKTVDARVSLEWWAARGRRDAARSLAQAESAQRTRAGARPASQAGRSGSQPLGTEGAGVR